MTVLMRPGPHTAASILRTVFRRIDASFAFRLWDGSEVRFGSSEPVMTILVHSSDTFVALMRHPSAGNFADAYVTGRIDLDGDLFAAMEIANQVDSLSLSVGERLRILASLCGGRG